MGWTKRAATTLAAVAALSFGVAAPAFATVVNVGGGTWDYGTNSSYVWSNYYHGSSCHRSSVQGKFYASSGNVAAGSWSHASAPQRPFKADYSYWSYC